MLTLKAISKRYELTAKQTRNLWQAVGPTLAPYTERGANNAVLVNESAIPVLDRAMQLKREGLSLSAVADRLAHELGKLAKGSREDTGTQAGQTGNEPLGKPQATRANPEFNGQDDSMLFQVLIEQRDHLKTLLRAKDDELERVIGLLEDVQGQVKAMLPANSEGRQRLSRWQHFRAVFIRH